MGLRLSKYFEQIAEAGVTLGEARMQLKMGMSKQRASTIEDSPEILDKAARVYEELIKTKDLFARRSRSHA